MQSSVHTTWCPSQSVLYFSSKLACSRPNGHVLLHLAFTHVLAVRESVPHLTLKQVKVALIAQGTIVDMLEDVNTGINWVMQKISHYGGDPEQVYLVGQSCGAQLCSLTTLLQVPPRLQLLLHPDSSPCGCGLLVHGHVLDPWYTVWRGALLGDSGPRL